jgi:hypothetical protein
MPAPVVVKKAKLICYRIYDIAEEIDLSHVERISRQGASRTRLVSPRSRALLLPNPPVTLELGSKTLELKTGSFSADVRARLFDSGALSVALSLPVPAGSELDALAPLAAEVQDAEVIETLCAHCVEQVRSTIAPAVKGDHLWSENESYTVVLVDELEPKVTAAELIERADLVRLVLGEDGDQPLSAAQRSDVLAHRFSYTEQDLTIVDWNGAFVYEPGDASDILDVLEIANAQLLELRYYDDQLDRHIQRIYDDMQQGQRRWRWLFLSPYGKLAPRVAGTLLELSEFVERSENSLRVIGDFYVAKIYEAAVQQLRVSNWQANVTRKQQMLANTYQLLKGETDTDRSLVLEALIVVLIIFEILLALLKVY